MELKVGGIMNCPDCDGFVCCAQHAKYIHNTFHDPKVGKK